LIPEKKSFWPEALVDCGDAGHVLLSKSVADFLIQLSVAIARRTRKA